ncbi:Forkhead-associated (FHA) domain [Trinorchestia longiramus]|nr:Forkhead-associated (FHA) domain [Trinorchestia longiramus]
MCQTTCTIGKHFDSDIRVQLDTVSARHASISVLQDGKCVLHSLSATNPVEVNGVALFQSSHKALSHKDVLTVGDRLLRWEYSVSSPHYPHAQLSSFVFSTPTKFVGMSTPRQVAGSASAKKRKRPPRESSESSVSDRKRVSFGPYLSPEQFDQQLPTSTPVRKGEKPNFSSPIPVGSPMVLARHPQVNTTRNASLQLPDTNVPEDTPKSLLRRRSPTPIKPHLARSLGFVVPTSAKKTAAKSPTAGSSSKTSSSALKAKSPKSQTPSLILKQRKLAKLRPLPSEASKSSLKAKRGRSESPSSGCAEKSSKAPSSRSRSVGAARGMRDSSASRPAKVSKTTVSPKAIGKLSKTPKKRRESSFTVTPKISPSKSSPGRVLSPKKEIRRTSFIVTSVGTMSPKFPGEKLPKKVSNSLSPKKSSTPVTSRELVKMPFSVETTPTKAGEALKTPKSASVNTQKSSLKKTMSPVTILKSLSKKSPSPKKTPKSLTKKSPSKKTPESLTKKSSSPKKTPKSLTKKSPSPKETPKSLTKESPSPMETPKSLTKKSPSPKTTPKSLTKKSPSPKKTPKSLTEKSPFAKKTPKSLTKKSPFPKKTPKSLTKKSSPEKTPEYLTKKTPSPNKTPKSRTTPAIVSPKSSLKSTPVSSKRVKATPKLLSSAPKSSKSMSKASSMALKTPRLAWSRGSFASVVKRGGGQAAEAKQRSITVKKALKAVVKAREFKAKKNKALNGKLRQTSDLQLSQDIPKKFHFGAVSSTGHADSPAPIIIYKKTGKTPKVFRKGRKSGGRLAAPAGTLDLSGIEALMASPVQMSSSPKPHGYTSKSASNSPTQSSTANSRALKSIVDSSTLRRSASRSLSPRSASRSLPPRCASRSLSPRSASRSLSPRSASRSLPPRSASRSPPPRSASRSLSPRSASRSLSPRSTSKLSGRSPKSVRKSLPVVSKSAARISSPFQVAETLAPESVLSVSRAASATKQSNARSTRSPGSQLLTSAQKSGKKSASPLETPNASKSQGRIVKTSKSVESSLRLVRSFTKTSQGSKSTSKASASSSRTLGLTEDFIASPESQFPSVTQQSSSQSSKTSSTRTPYNSPKQLSSPLFMPSLAENGSRLGDFTSRKSLGIHPTEPRKISTRRTRSLGKSEELTSTQLRDLFAANAMTLNTAGSEVSNVSRGSTLSPSSRSSSRLDFTSVQTPNITQDRFISPLGTPHYKQPDAMLLSSLATKRTPSSPAAASPSFRAPGSNVAIVNPIQRQTVEEKDPSPGVSRVKQGFSRGISPYSSYYNVEGVKQLLRSPRTPENDLRNVSGLKVLLQRSPGADYTNVENVKQLFASNRGVSLNDSTLASLSAMVNSPVTSESPLEIHEVLNVVSSPPKSSNSPIQIVTSRRSDTSISSVTKSPASKAPEVVDLTSDEDVGETPWSEVQKRVSRRTTTPVSAAKGKKRPAAELDESPVTRNSKGMVSGSPLSKKTNSSASSRSAKTTKSSAKPASESLEENFAKSAAKTPGKSPVKTVKSPARTPVISPATTSEESSVKIPTESPVLKSPAKPLLRVTRGRAAKAKGKTKSPITKAVTPSTPKPARSSRRGKTVTASPLKDASSNSASTPAPDVSPQVTRRRAAPKKIDTPVVASPANTSHSKSPTPVKRTTRGRRAAAVVSTPVKKASPVRIVTLVISPVKALPQNKISPKQSPPVKRTTRGKRVAAVKSTPVKKNASEKDSNIEQTPVKETTLTAEKSPHIPPKKTRGKRGKTGTTQKETPVVASVTSKDKSPAAKSPAKKPSRSRLAAKKASPQKTKATAAKKTTSRKTKTGGSNSVTPQESEESSPQTARKVSPVKAVGSPPGVKVTRARRATVKRTSSSSKTPSPKLLKILSPAR